MTVYIVESSHGVPCYLGRIPFNTLKDAYAWIAANDAFLGGWESDIIGKAKYARIFRNAGPPAQCGVLKVAAPEPFEGDYNDAQDYIAQAMGAECDSQGDSNTEV